MSGLERLAVLNGLRDSLTPIRIAKQFNMWKKTVQRIKGPLFRELLNNPVRYPKCEKGGPITDLPFLGVLPHPQRSTPVMEATATNL